MSPKREDATYTQAGNLRIHIVRQSKLFDRDRTADNFNFILNPILPLKSSAIQSGSNGPDYLTV